MDVMLTCTESLLSECQQYWEPSSIAICDGIVLKLCLLSRDFSSFLEDSSEDPNLNPTTVAQLLDLHNCVRLLLIQWESKLLDLEGLFPATECGGRSGKIEMVSCAGHYVAIYYKLQLSLIVL